MGKHNAEHMCPRQRFAKRVSGTSLENANLGANNGRAKAVLASCLKERCLLLLHMDMVSLSIRPRRLRWESAHRRWWWSASPCWLFGSVY